ncbi:TlpA family protein disulfide reductase [Caldimonas thermodepolymerans]|jgi:Thiol-disulfide isomerase and thioredoxins|uniref:Thioredoxin n=1 Tax=Caldimonas thermodepolymerans TaxID=215580 RepID=A0A2S5T5E0_9BURK|nr:TlpA disulfide reductase family protein [Caldimonas thermodepolymerans]PPE70214.1 thioredoxin [Caldimonas thermodepolymerans]QPC32208.1 TlpA family protein disulfide reductase [Caldimonas thermodepolymerans]RDH98097.1 thiol-disulfide isomerase/thioredoxin [Caldimonas thermodepolymerans]TCP08128.1 thiol-disulfide isomerase/thioredoxin [Caldimonas thermodepolymerans]UZG45009.1 TlpA family protein disulfide reductase [Caldimonas thermodepolymerans]
MKKTTYLAAAAVALAIGAAGYFALGQRETAPDVSYVLLDGTRQNFSDLKGQVVLVNFWATSCVTCVKEMPQMVQTYQKYRDRGLDFVAVAMSYDPPAYVDNFAKTRQLPFKVAIDNTGEIARRFGDVKLTPTTYLLNKRGEVVKRYVGEPDFAALHQLVEQLLAET